jgi:hypothetical protein
MDTGYADAVNRLTDDVERACSRVDDVLSNKEIADELRRIAKSIEEEGL